MDDSPSFAGFATVSREWQEIVERRNFARIKVTTSRLASFNSVVYRNRALVRYIWFCVELEEYGCPQCEHRDEASRMGQEDTAIIGTAMRDLLSTLSDWEPNGDLLLGISVHSPSDSDHSFKYLTFLPDIPPEGCDRVLCEKQSMLAKANHESHGWKAGSRSWLCGRSLFKLFTEFSGLYDLYKESRFVPLKEIQTLPSVPVVTGLLIRQQTRRRWSPLDLEQTVTCFPRLQEICYEPWRGWYNFDQWILDRCKCCCVSSLFSAMHSKCTCFCAVNR